MDYRYPRKDFTVHKSPVENVFLCEVRHDSYRRHLMKEICGSQGSLFAIDLDGTGPDFELEKETGLGWCSFDGRDRLDQAAGLISSSGLMPIAVNLYGEADEKTILFFYRMLKTRKACSLLFVRQAPEGYPCYHHPDLN